jgi:hypothetical protein
MKMMRRKKGPATLAQEVASNTTDNTAIDRENTFDQIAHAASAHVDISIFVESVSGEYSRGLQALANIGPCVTVFGSARTKPGDPAYADAMQVGRQLATAGFAVATGGGGGIMEAANRGAALGGGGSIGMPIVLPFEQSGNEFLELSVTFDHFPARKTCLIKACDAVVVFTGGFGTLDELFEVLTLIQTGKMNAVPIILVGSYYWSGLLDWLRTSPTAAGCIGEQDLDLMTVVDTPEAAIEAVTSQLARRV